MRTVNGGRSSGRRARAAARGVRVQQQEAEPAVALSPRVLPPCHSQEMKDDTASCCFLVLSF